MNPDAQTDIKQRDFLKIYDEYSDAIFRYCLIRTSDREKALDLTQDVFAKTWKYIASGKTIDFIKAFLYRIATNAIIDDRRKKKTVSLENLMEQGFDYSKGDEALEKEVKFESEKAIQAIKDLDEKYRDVLLLRYAEEFSVKEIAEIIGERENNVSVRIHRGLEKLKMILKEQQ